MSVTRRGEDTSNFMTVHSVATRHSDRQTRHSKRRRREWGTHSFSSPGLPQLPLPAPPRWGPSWLLRGTDGKKRVITVSIQHRRQKKKTSPLQKINAGTMSGIPPPPFVAVNARGQRALTIGATIHIRRNVATRRRLDASIVRVRSVDPRPPHSPATGAVLAVVAATFAGLPATAVAASAARVEGAAALGADHLALELARGTGLAASAAASAAAAWTGCMTSSRVRRKGEDAASVPKPWLDFYAVFPVAVRVTTPETESVCIPPFRLSGYSSVGFYRSGPFPRTLLTTAERSDCPRRGV